MPILSTFGGGSIRGFKGLGRGTLYAFTAFTFTNCAAYGALGPTTAQKNSAYSATAWAATYISVSNGTQIWTVPTTGTYRIEVAGAAGGNTSENSVKLPGYGYIVRGDVTLTGGTTLNILVGQKGQNVTCAGNQAAPGGGGSFVWVPGATQPLLVGAGGNGESWGNHTVQDPSGRAHGGAAYTGTGGRGCTGAGWLADGVAGEGSPAYCHAANIKTGYGYGANYSNSSCYGSETFPGNLSGSSGSGGGFGGGGTATPYEGGGGGGYYRGVTKTTNAYTSPCTEFGAVSYIGAVTNGTNVGLKSSETHGYVTITRQ